MDQNYPRNGQLFGINGIPAYMYDTGSESISQGCKNAMADGRVFTDYRPNCRTNQLLRYVAGINNSRDYRAFLQHNADKLRDIDRMVAARNAGAYCACDKNFVNYSNACNSTMNYDWVVANPLGGVRANTDILFNVQPVSEVLTNY